MNHKNITPGTLVESSVSSTDISSDEINQLKAQIQANEKWLTDITEFAIPAGKVYLSPIVDCFDGLLVNWNISTSPDALLVNSMLDNAAKLLSVGENQSYIQTEAYTTAGQAGLTGWRKMVSYDQCQRKAVHLIILPVRAYLEELKMRCSIMQIGLG